jgi:hypothetical protein
MLYMSIHLLSISKAIKKWHQALFNEHLMAVPLEIMRLCSLTYQIATMNHQDKTRFALPVLCFNKIVTVSVDSIDIGDR